jgi:hypothetical protein
VFQHQPSAVLSEGGCAPDLTDSSGVKPGPAPGPRHPRTTSPGWRMVCCCTAAKYSNRVDRHRLNVTTNGPRRAETTPIDRSARSSGRRGRGFESRHPDSKTPAQRLCAIESRWPQVTNCVTIGSFFRWCIPAVGVLSAVHGGDRLPVASSGTETRPTTMMRSLQR